MKRVLLFLILVQSLLPIAASPLDVPQLQGYVNDYADTISPSTEAQLARTLKAFEESDSTQVVILTIPSLEGETMEEYSIQVAESWKIGQRAKDNGILLVVSKQDRKIRIEVGRGLEGRLTDLLAGRIIDLAIKPKFRAGDFDGGFTAGVSALIDATRGEFKANERRQPEGRSSGLNHPPQTLPFGLPLWLFFVFGFGFFIVFLIAASRASHRAIRRGHHAGGWYLGGGDFPSSGGSSGESGGDFRGGGGEFGGGGASGNW